MLLHYAAIALGLLLSVVSSSPLFSQKYHPVVIWHGLGDSAYSEGMLALASELKEAFPGIFVHLIHVGDDLGSDQKAGFFGSVNDQIDKVCQDLQEVKELKNGFDAIGFSQGGQFLRGYVERCNSPSIRNLVTMGSQHMGIADLPACKPGDIFCKLAEGALRGGIYTDYAQSNLITAQYFRDPTNYANYQKYLEANHFLTDINNEVLQNKKYKERLQSLDAFLMLMFDKDVVSAVVLNWKILTLTRINASQTVRPKESSWFASYPIANDDGMTFKNESKVLPLRQSDLYKQDKLGLKTLDKRGSLVMDVCHGAHMQIDSACQMKVFGKYVGLSPPSFLMPSFLRPIWARTVYSITGLRTSSLPSSLQLLLLLFAALVVQSAVTLGSTTYQRYFSSRSVTLE